MAETEVDEVIEENVEEGEAEEGSPTPIETNDLVSEESDSGKINSDVLQNIAVTISVEVGRTSLKIRDLMRLTQVQSLDLT